MYSSSSVSPPSKSFPSSPGRQSSSQFSDELEGDINDFRRIEGLEQELIQHVRTSGVRKQRETSLVDEVMEIRTERRQLFSGLSSLSLRLQRENKELKATIAGYGEIIEDEVKSRTAVVLSELSLRTDEIRALKEEFSVRERRMCEKLLERNREEVEGLKSKYESQLTLLEGKIKDVEVVRRQQMSDDVAKMAEQLAGKAVAEAQEKYSENTKRYKEALRSIAEREKDMEEAVKQMEGRCKRADTENEVLKEKVERMEEVIAAMKARLKEEKGLRAEAEKREKSLSDDIIRERSENQRTIQEERDAKRALLAEAEERHKQELSSIDDKVRKLLLGKEEAILGLKEELVLAREKRMETERMIIDLNENFAPPRSPSRKDKHTSFNQSETVTDHSRYIHRNSAFDRDSAIYHTAEASSRAGNGHSKSLPSPPEDATHDDNSARYYSVLRRELGSGKSRGGDTYTYH